MWPIGDFDRLVNEIKRREEPDYPVTFGVLIADYRQQRCREYMLNYIERFDTVSGKYINFYLPGYIDDDHFANENKISIGSKNYYFDSQIYIRFLDKLEIDFGIQYTYNPELILFEYDRGHFGTSKRIVIELDRNGNDIQNVGQLFENVFDIAKQKVRIEEFSKDLSMRDIKAGLFDKLVDSIGINALNNVNLIRTELGRYKIVGK